MPLVINILIGQPPNQPYIEGVLDAVIIGQVSELELKVAEEMKQSLTNIMDKYRDKEGTFTQIVKDVPQELKR